LCGDRVHQRRRSPLAGAAIARSTAVYVEGDVVPRRALTYTAAAAA